MDVLHDGASRQGEEKPPTRRSIDPSTPRRRAQSPAGIAATTGEALDRLIDLAHRSSAERRLGVTRVVAALAVLVVMEVGSDPFHSYAVTLLTAAYGVYSLGILALLWRLPSATASAALAVHVGDLTWATATTALSGGASSHTFALFLFVLAAAAYRWSLSGSLYTGAVVLAVASVEALAAEYRYVGWPFEFDTFLELSSFVAVLAVLFGLLAERLHALGAQAIALGEVLERVGRASSMGGALHEALGQILELFRAREAVLVVREFDRHGVFVWHAQPHANGRFGVSRQELSRNDCDALFFPVPPAVRTWEIRQTNRDDPAFDTHALSASGAIASEPLSVPPALPCLSSWRSLTITVTNVPGCWSGRLFLIDAARPRDVVLRLGLMQKLVQQVTPTLTSLYLMRRLRSRAGASERARLARELHDGIVQTLAVLEMRLELVGRRVADVDPALSDDLQGTREMLRADVMALRELIERVRPTEVDAERLPAELRDRVDRFSSMSGIKAQFVWTAKAVDLTRRQCEEVLRIVQEALVNVRRHSGASRVFVRIAVDASDWEVVIEDNGHGFGFTGRLTHRELEERKEGPRVIRERVESLGGSLLIESSEGGSRLEIVIPRVYL